MNLAGKISGLSGDADVLFGGESYNASVRVSSRIDQVYDFHILVEGLPEFLAFGLVADHSSFVARLDFEREVELRAYKLKGGVLWCGNDYNLLIVFYIQIMPDDFVMQLHRF